MTLENLALFKGIGAKMDFLNSRQRVISQNISNADTPGYRPRDLVNADFSDVLNAVSNKTSDNGVKPVRLETTQAGHMPTPGDVNLGQNKKQRVTYEVAPAGNSVIIEEQLINSGKTVMDYNMMTNLMQKHMGMIRTSLGGS